MHAAYRANILLIILLSLPASKIECSTPSPSMLLPELKCSAEMNQKAVALLPQSRENWHSLIQHYHTFGACDDGELGEGYSDAVVKFLAYRWDRFDDYVAEVARNPAIEAWVLSHIDASGSDDDLKKVLLNSSRCAKDSQIKDICIEIMRAAKGALSGSSNH